MPKYDFHKLLEPYEFQYLVRDIIQIRDKITLESFSAGPDGGIDLRKKDHDNTIIVQIKRTKNDFVSFFKYLKKNELPKVENLKPNRYILATSVTLGVTQKQKILDLFKGYIKNPEDILSELDLNNLLGQKKYKHIELDYSNLWFDSATSFFEKMDKLINNDLYEEARAEYDNIRETMKYYIPPTDFKADIKLLKQNRYLLITGNPGIGKTSLARALCAYFIQKEKYQFIFTRSVESANRVYNPKKKQIFFFDDFWGSSFKEYDYNFNEERKLAEFIKKVNTSKNKMLILTSRDYVLKQGLLSNLELEEKFDTNKCILTLKSYSLELRMKILLRHLFKSNLKYNYIDIIVRNAHKIINHRNFNPRIIERYINSGYETEFNYRKYFKIFIETLDEPFEFLDIIFKKQSNEAQLFLYLLLTINGPILSKDFNELYVNALNIANEKGIHLENYDITNIIGQLEKNFIKTNYVSTFGIVINFINPSIKDYLYEYQTNFLKFERILIESLVYFNQYEFLLKNRIKLTNNSRKSLVKNLLENFGDLRIIRGEFFQTIPYEKMNTEQHLVNKIRNTLSLDNIEKEVVDFLLKKYEDIQESLTKHERKYIYEDDLACLIQLYEKVSKYKELNGQEIIKLYYDNCIHTYELYLIKEFEELFPTEYKNFIKNKNKEINNRYKKMISYDLNYFYCNKMFQSLSELLFLLDTELRYIYDKNIILKSEIDYYSDIPQEFYDWEDTISEDETRSEFDDMPQDDFNIPLNTYGFTESYLTDEELNEELKKELTKEEIIDINKQIEDSVYLYHFIDDKESLSLIIKLFKTFKLFPKKVTEFCSIFIEEALIEEDIDIILGFEKVIGIGIETFYKNEIVFTKNTLKDSTFNINLKEKNINKILNCKIFKRCDKWIKFTHPLIHFYCISYGISLLDSKEKEKLYSDIIFALSSINEQIFEFGDDIIFFYSCLMEKDPQGFSNYYIYDILNYFLKSIDKTNKKSIIKSIIKFFAISIEFESLYYQDLNKHSTSIINYETWSLLQQIFESYFNLDYFLTKESFDEFKNIICNKFSININNLSSQIKLYELVENKEFYDWLQKYKLDKKIMDLYTSVTVLTEFCQKDYLDSFEAYHKYLNNIIKQKNKN